MTRRNGVIFAIVLGVLDIVTLFVPTGEGPPPGVVYVISIGLGALTIIGALLYLRSGSNAGLWLTIATRALSGLSNVLAFVFDAPTSIKVMSAVLLILNLVSVGMMVKKEARIRT